MAISPRLDTNFLLIRLGNFERFAKTTATNSQRSVYSKECVVLTHEDLELKAFQNYIDLTINERADQASLWEDDRDKIGAFIATDDHFHGHVSIYVRREVFDVIWAAAGSVDGAIKNIQIEYEISKNRKFANIYSATFSEAYPYDTNKFASDDIVQPVVNPRIHPVVAELRSWSRSLSSLSACLQGVGVLAVIPAAMKPTRCSMTAFGTDVSVSPPDRWRSL